MVIALAVVSKKSNTPDSSPKPEKMSTWECVLHPGSQTPELDKAKCLLGSSPLVDGHNDFAMQFRAFAKNKVYSVDLYGDLQKEWNISHTDIPRLRQGIVGAQFWAIYVECYTQYKDAVRQSLDQLDVIRKFVNKYPDVFRFVTTAQGQCKEGAKNGITFTPYDASSIDTILLDGVCLYTVPSSSGWLT
ncbi:hypothetical protein CHS0354_009342 [Potamilus streckersoni]|uniref:Dipeptidase n=1 Tax=Potamilus streckersoni TaxID=2493646 RepID=A0AAE0SN32_9BIVA|nr:hypothetical protein CHS0354_009342 [Potamilus streckersoni]